VIVASGKNVLCIIRELNSCETTVFRREVFDRNTSLKVPELSYTVATSGNKEVAA
jgi:hypothetical protein